MATCSPRLDMRGQVAEREIRRRLQELEAKQRGLWREGQGRHDAYRDRPTAFIREVLREELWSIQAAIAEALVRRQRVTVRSCNGAGKTFLAARLAVWFLLTRPGAIVVTTAPTWRQVKDQIWRYIRTCHGRAKLPGECNQTEWNLGPDWYAVGISTDDPTRFQGTHSPAGVLLVVDEASGVPESIYEAGAGFMTQQASFTLLIGNPNTPAGTFYNSHQRGDWERFHISAYDVPESILSREYIERAKSDWGEDSPAYQVRVLGEFPDESDDTLIGMRYVAQAQQADLEPEGEIVAGADISRFGNDESAIYARQGSKVLAGVMWRGQDTQESAGRIAAFCREHRVSRVNVDEIGVGAGVVDRLKEVKVPVVGVNVGTAARDSERFANLRAEMFWGLRTRFRDGDVDIPSGDDVLYSQLCALKYKYTPAGKVQIESKDEMKARGLPSPDRADTLALAFHSAKRARAWAY